MVSSSQFFSAKTVRKHTLNPLPFHPINASFRPIVTPDKFTNIEKTGDEFYKGYAYLAAGLCCGFSSLVRKILLLMPVLAIIPHLSFLNLLRLLVWLLVLSVMLVSALVTVGVGEDFGSEQRQRARTCRARARASGGEGRSGR